MAVKERARIVFVTEDGDSGDERIFLLYLVRWLRDHGRGGLEVLAWRRAPVLDRFRYAASVQVLGDVDHWPPARVFEVLRFTRVTQVLKGARLRWWLLQRRKADLLYVNGLPAARLLAFLPRWPMRVVVHVHDANDLEDGAVADADRTAIRRHTDLFVAASEEIAEQLRERWDLPAAQVLVHEFVVAGEDGPLTSPDPPTREDLGIEADDLVIGSTAPADWWATPEQFVLVAWGLRQRRPELPWRFLWVTDDADERRLWPLHHDLRNAGLDDRTVVWSSTTPLDLLAAMDLLVLSTRHEPQELLVFEAAGAGVAVVGTDNLTGVLPDQTAQVVPYLDVDAMVDEVLALVDDPARRATAVDRALITARRHHDVSVGARELLARIGLDP